MSDYCHVCGTSFTRSGFKGNTCSKGCARVLQLKDALGDLTQTLAEVKR